MALTAQKKHSRLNLNLLYSQGAGNKLPIRFIRWLISYGRFIVVVVEIVVVSAFVYRFKLDADLANIKEQINEQIPYIESLSVNEAKIQQTNLRLSVIKKTYAASVKWHDILSKILRNTPTSIKFTNLSLEAAESTNTPYPFKISAQATTNNAVAVFLARLKKEDGFFDINLTSIALEEGQIVFTVTGNAK